jgi:hypothetical protein
MRTAHASSSSSQQLPENATIWLRDLQAIGDAAKKQLKLLSEVYERLPEKDKHATPSDCSRRMVR